MYEVLKSKKIPFKHRWLIDGKEVDFIIGNYVIEVNGHDQDTQKNEFLASRGFSPIHIHNSEVSEEYIINLINKIL